MKNQTTARAGFVALLAALCVMAMSPATRAADRSDRPNIVLIVADDLGYGELGCYGQRWIQTPHLDELARRGMRFTQFYSGSPVCAPSRCVLMTGKHAGHAAVRDNRNPSGMKKLREQYDWQYPGQTPLPQNEQTIAELLKARGYATGAAGKWGLGQVGNVGDPRKQGFDLFYGYYCQVHAHNHYPAFLWRNATKEKLRGNHDAATGETHSHTRFTEEALTFLRAHREEPFFLYMPFTIPHVSIQAPEEALQEYAGQLPESPYEHRDKYFPHPSPHAGYAAMVSELDRSVGKIVATLDELGLSNNTLLLFTSDNGPTHDRAGGADSDFFNSSGPLRDRKGSLYEGGIRVPLIACWPERIAANREAAHVAASYDVLPTVCEVAGIAPPANLDGISFAATLLGEPGQQTHQYLYWEFPGYACQQAVRMGDWKAIRSRLDRGDSKFELYDLKADVAETNNLAGERPEVVQQIEEIARGAHVPSPQFPLLANERER